MTAHMALVRQAGGKWGQFVCPLCGGVALWKFTPSAGFCEACNAQFILTEKGDQIRWDCHSHGDRLIQMEQST